MSIRGIGYACTYGRSRTSGYNWLIYGALPKQVDIVQIIQLSETIDQMVRGSCDCWQARIQLEGWKTGVDPEFSVGEGGAKMSAANRVAEMRPFIFSLQKVDPLKICAAKSDKQKKKKKDGLKQSILSNVITYYSNTKHISTRIGPYLSFFPLIDFLRRWREWTQTAGAPQFDVSAPLGKKKKGGACPSPKSAPEKVHKNVWGLYAIIRLLFKNKTKWIYFKYYNYTDAIN